MASVGGEQADVGVEAGGGRVVVAGADVGVEPHARRLVAHDERDLAVHLEVGEPYEMWTPASSSLRAQLDVVRLVEAGRQLDDDGDLLALGGGGHQCLEDRRVGRGAVQRLLDREHLRVVRGLLDEADDGRVERLVGVVHQQVALAQRLPQPPGVVLEAGEARRHGGREARERQLLDVERGELHQVGGVDEVIDLDHVGLVEFELVEQHLAVQRGQAGGAFEGDGVGEAAALDLRLDQLAEVLGGLAGGFRPRRCAGRARGASRGPRRQRRAGRGARRSPPRAARSARRRGRGSAGGWAAP